ncbi:multidrug efflux RND transporter permease subunit [Pendulispora rubella]|uniref:Multidrug efflux RND transporter permease subunit n=1 Tax=Pendulispora rubella TaxID=2741070 RepID=A0ABZ2L7W5_9BACT
MNISAPFIQRPIATSLMAAAVLLAGIVAFLFLPVASLPRIDYPTINVWANLPGASPETMASAVATPLERRFARIAGITEITSSSSLGSTSIQMQFELGRDVDRAARDVQAAINAAAGELPANMPWRPGYWKVNPSDPAILVLAVKSDTLPLPQVADAADAVLAHKISQVPGVGQVFTGGDVQPAVRVQVDPVALAGMGLGMVDVRQALEQATVDQPKGALGDAQQAHALSANDQLFGAKQFEPLVLAHRDGATVRLKDVARVIDDVEDSRVAGWANGKPAVLIFVRRQPGANIIDVIARVRAMLPRLTDSLSPAIDVSVVADRSQTIRASVRDVEQTWFLSVGLVVLVVFAFLRNWRMTVIPTVAVPLSIVATFGVMYLLHYSLDNLSLMALTISTGFVVDDAIVVTENVTRYIELGDSPMQAALKGARQVGFTVVSITVSLIAVFIPILLMGGIIGRLFREFAVTLSIAVAVSAVVSLTLTPVMCARLLRPKHEETHGPLYEASERFFERMLNGYARGLRWVLGHHRLTLFITLATLGLTVALYVIVPKGFFPQQDTGFISGFVEAAQDTSFAVMQERQAQVDAILRADPDVAQSVSFVGGGGPVNTGSAYVALKPLAERQSSADEVIARLRPKFERIPGVAVYLQANQDVRVGGRFSRTQYQYTLQDTNLEELREWTPKVVEALKKLPEVRDVASDQQIAGLEMAFAIDRDTAARLGVSPRDIDDALYDAYGQRQVAITYTQVNQYRVVMEMKPEYLKNTDGLQSIYVRAADGSQVPLASLVTQKVRPTSLAIPHQGQFPATTVSFALAPGVALGQAVDAVHRAELAIGLPPSVHADFQGTAQAYESSLSSQPVLIMAAIFIVYIVLGVLYESLVHPITILSTLPSAGVGALLALLAFKTELGVISIIGIILLVGIVKKNAIMMIDFAIEVERDENLSAREAIYKASVLRFRPIMMTTMAALLGALPLALGHGMGSELRRPLGIAIVGGLLISQALTLFTVPVIYLYMDRFTRRKSHALKAEAEAESEAISMAIPFSTRSEIDLPQS